jgi:hypothetical protein
VVLHWGTWLGGGPLNGVSLWKRMCAVQDFARSLQDRLEEGLQAVTQVLAQLARHLARIRPQPNKQKKASTRQLLLNPRLAP